MNNLRVSLLQITSTEDIESNFAKIRRMVDSESKNFTKGTPTLVCLPENFAYFGEESRKLDSVQEIASLTSAFLADLSRGYGIFLLGGGYPYPSEDGSRKCYNQASIYNPSGQEISRYRKIHLFDTEPGDGIQYRESSSTIAGDEIPIPILIGQNTRITTFICYDLRFPEVFRRASLMGADIICLPAAFTVPTGDAHWEVLLRARAIENLCYILAPAQVGENVPARFGKPSRITYGNTMIVDPWGRIVGRLDSSEEGILGMELDGSVLESSRKKIPALNHRRY